MGPVRLLLAVALLMASVGACKESTEASPPEATPSRFVSVKSTAATSASRAFCEKVFPKSGEGARKWTPPPSRPLTKKPRSEGEGPASGWLWLNLWASWCGPCLEEMPLLERWRASLAKEHVPVRFELWSTDEEEADLNGALDRAFPGRVHWLRGKDDLLPLLAALGVDENSALPIHALIDPSGQLRCVRVGEVGEGIYGTIRTLLSQE